jgi:acetyltransferase-like isoleucine patch superfamily enzyme
MIGSLILAVLPPFIAIRLRRLTGARIAESAHIGWLSLVRVHDLEMADHALIGSFAVVRAHHLSMGPRAAVKSLALLSTHTISLGEGAHVAPTAIVLGSLALQKSRLILGDHSRIFPFSWLEPGEGIEIGKQVGIGGHALIFTHGAWSDYLRGGPIAYGAVKIEDGVWLPWRVTVLAGVTIGANSIVMSGSVVTRPVPRDVIVGGAPATKIKDRGTLELDAETRLARAKEILDAFRQWHVEAYGIAPVGTIAIDDPAGLEAGDTVFYVNSHIGGVEAKGLVDRGISVIDHDELASYRASNDREIEGLVEFLTGYGIRLYDR